MESMLEGHVVEQDGGEGERRTTMEGLEGIRPAEVELTPFTRQHEAQADSVSDDSRSAHRISTSSAGSTPLTIYDLRQARVVYRCLPEACCIDDRHGLAPMRNIIQKMQQYAESQEFLPASARDELEKYPWLHHDHFFDSTSGREKFGGVPTHREVEHLALAANWAKTNCVPVPEWNDRVNGPVLRMALETSRHCDTLDVHNITSFPISRSCYPPSDIACLLPVSSRHVDYAITLSPDDSRLDELYPALRKERDASRAMFNQTDGAAICVKPIAISVDTKDMVEADRVLALWQLSMWALAQFRKAELLLLQSGGGEVQCAPLLMFSAMGTAWTPVIVVRDDETGFTTVYEGRPICSTDTKLGIYRLVAALQVATTGRKRSIVPGSNVLLPPDCRSHSRILCETMNA